MPMPYSERPFDETLRDLILESDHVTKLGTPNMAAFARAAEISYESLRKVLGGDRPLNMQLMEKAAIELGVPPQHFLEYRVMEAQRAFDPEEVGIEAALGNLQLWEAAQSARRRFLGHELHAAA